MAHVRKVSVGLVAFLVGCGGGAAENGGAKGGGAGGAREPAIGGLAAAQGGLSALGGGGNRESEPPPDVDATFRLDLVENGPPKLDGTLGEWQARLPAKTAIRGSAQASFASALQYDDAKIYVAGEVTDARFVRTARFADDEDHASLVLAFPSGGSFVTYEVGLFAGNPGESAGEVRWISGGQGEVPGARIVEAPANGGYTFEAAIPWSAFPEARTTRVGLRGAARYYDASAARGATAVVATGPGDAHSPRDLPWLPTEPEQSLIEGLLIPNRLGETPRVELFANLSGDARKERVAVYGRYFTICGPSYRRGKEFFFRDLGGDLVSLEARDVTGRGKDDLLVRRRFKVQGTKREWFEVWSLTKSDEPTTTFSHEIEVASGDKHVANAVHVASREIEVAVEPAVGWDASSYKEPFSTDVDPVLVPWGPVQSQTYRFDGTKFVKAREVAQAPAAGVDRAGRKPDAPAQDTRMPSEPPTPAVRRGGDLSAQLLDQYKRDHNLAPDAKPRFDLEVNVDGDARAERVVLLGRDLVVFGPGFRGGTQYATITLSMFESPADVKDLSARDLTGDGAADLVVRGARRVNAAGDASASTSADARNAPVEVEAMFVYQVRGGQLTRVFAVETAREQAGNRVQGLVQFVPAHGGKGFDIDVRPGVAKGWSEKTFPWRQEPPGAHGVVEPLLLPWGGVARARYAWNGTEFALAR